VLALALALVLGPDFPPLDEGGNDVQFAEFRQNLIGSIEKKNYDWALPRIATDIKYSLGEDGNKRELLKAWENIPSAREEFFGELLKCLKMGGQFKKYDGRKFFVAPYVFSAWPEDMDAFEFVAVPTPVVKVFAAADEKQEPIASVGHTIVRIDYSSQSEGWNRIEYEDGAWGWIMTKDVRSPLDYRAYFEKNGAGSYELVTFIAGD
jgi:hypothetical protein